MAGTVRHDPMGPLNRAVNLAFGAKVPRLVRRFVSLVLHVELPQLRHPIRLPHPYGIIVNKDVQMGANVTVFQGVTIGGKREGVRRGVPIIGDDVVIYPNAVVIGAVRVGHGATIGAGAVVIDDVPDGGVAVGNPAKVLGE